MADPRTASESQKSLFVFLPVKSRNGKPRAFPYYTVGTVMEGEDAVWACRVGIATPCDDECVAATGLTKDQLKQRQESYEMTSKGIHSPEDRELYRAGVILGYNKDSSYIHGPNWDAYQEALQAAEDESDI